MDGAEKQNCLINLFILYLYNDYLPIFFYYYFYLFNL